MTRDGFWVKALFWWQLHIFMLKYEMVRIVYSL